MSSPMSVSCARITVPSLVAAYFECGTVLNVGYLVANRVTAAMSASLVFIVYCLLLF